MVTTCKTCGAKFSIYEKQCPYCGNYVDQTEIEQWVDTPLDTIECENAMNQTNTPTDSNVESASGGLNVLSVFFPVIGWILCIALKQSHPRKAKFCKIWAWIGFGIWSAIYLWFKMLDIIF